ncbi:hypothetical protein [Bradyrhizobium niftali]|uniref:Uncharacterized protein n=1 Tax=Bradyrhizobium niftali TaxID=2560055 RepID=A0A4Y9LI89_9BRAD|nr:hypothetical protein [Bradyrhizobium niftali]TFV43228.1 hypothetical protein E4K65_33965 [Bradyrhizobium niftali]
MFDTVAALGSYLLTTALLASAAILILAGSYAQSFFLFPFLPTFFWSIGIAGIVALIGYIATHVKYAIGLAGPRRARIARVRNAVRPGASFEPAKS